MAAENNEKFQKITVYVDSDLISLIPEFLENREKDLITLKKALESEDYSLIQTIGHNLKGSGGSYGLDSLSEYGRLLEEAVQANNASEIGKSIEALSLYLQNLEVLESKKKGVCPGCGNYFQPKADEKYCPQCTVEKQEKIIEKSQVNKIKSEKRKGKTWLVLTWVLVIACIVILGIQIPKILDEARPNRPIRQGTYETDKMSDECIKNLWILSKSLQENKSPDVSLSCPASNEPYKLVIGKAYCPNPEKHNLKSLSVSKDSKIPEAVK